MKQRKPRGTAAQGESKAGQRVRWKAKAGMETRPECPSCKAAWEIVLIHNGKNRSRNAVIFMKFIQGSNGRRSEEGVTRGVEEVKGDERKEEKER